MEYGYFITDTGGNRKFFVEGCSYCRMSTSGQHELHCYLYQPLPEMNDQKLAVIRERSYIKYGVAWQYLATH